ncbi:MAG TPA: hypothetical protein VM261_09905 [Kofleriaceae bacterium]|nr:hypothetical protein [Kofleriaceae bacterium]
MNDQSMIRIGSAAAGWQDAHSSLETALMGPLTPAGCSRPHAAGRAGRHRRRPPFATQRIRDAALDVQLQLDSGAGVAATASVTAPRRGLGIVFSLRRRRD